MYKILNKTYTKLPTEDMEQEELVKWLIKNNYFFFATKNENNQSFNNKKYFFIRSSKVLITD